MKEEIELLAMSQRSGSFESLENDHNDASSRNIGFTKSTEDITEIFSTLENKIFTLLLLLAEDTFRLYFGTELLLEPV